MSNRNDYLSKIEVKGFNKSLLNLSGKGMHHFEMIENGDRICVGISGGKDSLTLFNILLRVKFISNVDFEIFPVFVSKKREIRKDILEIKEYIKSFGYELAELPSNIEEVVYDDKKLKNPCSLCARMRIGILYKYMLENNLNKLALGHHLDDFAETFLMNLFFQGNLNKMEAKYRSKEYGVEIIRPLVFVEEDTIIKYVKKAKIPVISCDCKIFTVKKDPKRLEMKVLIRSMKRKNPKILYSIKSAILLKNTV